MNKRLGFLLVIFFVVAFFGIWYLSSRNATAPGESEASPTPTASTVVQPKSGSTGGQSGTADKTELYTDLVNEYAGRRMQFDIACQAIPSSATYKNGTKFMLDNRSGDPRIITVGGVQHQLAGYGYKIITLTSSELPKNLLVSCGSAVNVGQILLQN